RPAAPILMLFAIGAGSVFALIFFGGVSLDREAREASIDEVSAQNADRTQGLESISHDYAWWDDAVQNLAVRFSDAWARANLGPDTITMSYPQVGGIMVLGGDGRMLYGFLGKQELVRQTEFPVTGGLAVLADQARAA